MSDSTFTELEATHSRDGATPLVDRLISELREQKDYHRLFDALLLKKKHQMGLPLIRPASFDDVPEAQQSEFEEAYIAAAREVGDLFLAEGNIPRAWLYLRTIREPAKVTAAIDAFEIPAEGSERTEELINVALYEGAHPVKGLELLLRTHGTCNTITAFDQHIQQVPVEQRRQAAALLARELYSDLRDSVARDIERHGEKMPEGPSLRELISGRDWLFADGNYHIDVSHLHSVVRFSRFLDKGDPELDLARQLAEYGSHLATQFQYAGEPPFDDYYRAHAEYFRVVAGDDLDAALSYFRQKLDSAEDERDRPLLAFVLVDLLCRAGRLEEAQQLAEQHLRDIEEPAGFSFSRLCRQSGRIDRLREIARERGDLVTFAAALIEGK